MEETLTPEAFGGIDSGWEDSPSGLRAETTCCEGALGILFPVFDSLCKSTYHSRSYLLVSSII